MTHTTSGAGWFSQTKKMSLTKNRGLQVFSITLTLTLTLTLTQTVVIGHQTATGTEMLSIKSWLMTCFTTLLLEKRVDVGKSIDFIKYHEI